MNEVRTERSRGLGERLTGTERAALVAIRHTDGYEVLLDLMERACIEQETNLINARPEDEKKVLAEHKMAKAFWQVFTAMQTRVEIEIAAHLGLLADQKQREQDTENFDPAQEMLSPYRSTRTGLVEDE